MDTPVGKVLQIRDGTATVRVDRGAVCPRCAEGKGCGAGLSGGRERPVNLQLDVPNDIALQQGDEVALTLEPRHLLKAAFYAYGLPLLAVVVLLVVGWLSFGPLGDARAAVLAALGLAVGLLIGRRLVARDRCLEQFVPGIAARNPPRTDHG